MNNLEKHFVNYQQAMYLKSIGFDEPCFAGYRDFAWIGTDGPNSRYFHAQLFSNHQFDDDQKEYCSAPLKSQVFDWFRKEHQLFGTVLCDLCWNISGGIANSYGDAYDWDSEKFKTYEEAESTCIDKLIEIVKNK